MHDISILAIIWTGVFIASYMAHKTRLTPVLWYLFWGAFMVNIGMLPQVMPEFIVSFSELGIIIIMFALGFEEDTHNFLKSVKRSWGIALFGALTPFLIAYAAAWYFWQDQNMALIIGLAMTATAVSLTMVSLKSEGLSGTLAATGIMTSAVLDSIVSLALVAIFIPIATGEADISAMSILLITGKAVAFFLLVTLIGGVLFPSDSGWFNSVPLLGKKGLRNILSMGYGEYIILSLLLIAVLIGLLAHEFGLHPAVGAYMAGLVIRREYFDFHQHKNINFYKQSKTMIDNVAFSWIGPVFFVALGSQLIFDSKLMLDVFPQVFILFISLFIGQILSASLAARYIGRFDWSSSWIIGMGMLGRAELAFVVLNIAYVQYPIISIEAFYTLMLTMFILNISVPVVIRIYKPYFILQQSKYSNVEMSFANPK